MESRIIVTAELSQIRGHFTQIPRVTFCVPLVNLSLALPFNHFLIFIYLILFRTATHEKRFFTFLNYLGRRWKLSQVLSDANICKINYIHKFIFVNVLLILTTNTSVPFFSIYLIGTMALRV